MTSKKIKEPQDCAICGRIRNTPTPTCSLHGRFVYYLVRQDGEWKISEKGMQMAEKEGLAVRCEVAE